MFAPTSFANVAASGAVKAAGGQLVSVLLTAGSGAAATLTLYDNPSAASGTILCILSAPQGETAPPWTPTLPQVASQGIYAAITGAGANGTVVYI